MNYESTKRGGKRRENCSKIYDSGYYVYNSYRHGLLLIGMPNTTNILAVN
jgi:hypothetical protein